MSTEGRRWRTGGAARRRATGIRGLLLAALAAVTGCDGRREAFPAPHPRAFEGRTLVVFVGSASQPPTAKAVARFMAETGARVEMHVGGSGEMLARMTLSSVGDIYFPGSSDYMEIAKREGLVDPATETIVACLVPAITVPSGNPAGIETLEDLARPGVRVAIARPDAVCVGLYAVEVLERAGLASAVRPNIVTYTESCAKTAQVVALGQVDAALGWEVFEHWDPQRIRTILLPPERVPRIGFLPAAITTTCRDHDLARAFLAFLVSEEGQAIYAAWKYLTTIEAARRLTRPDAPVGGEWRLPEGW